MFQHPRSYPVSTGPSSSVASVPPPSTIDKWANTPHFKSLKASFPSRWLWAECNMYADKDITLIPKQRYIALRAAPKTLPLYPPRPTDLTNLTSPSIDILQEVLGRAPDSTAEPTEGLATTSNPSEDGHTVWGDEYLDDLFTALIGVVRDDGLGEDGWRTIRWLVYDTVSGHITHHYFGVHPLTTAGLQYSKCFGSLEYTRPDPEHLNGRWRDDAFTWLLGKLDAQQLAESLRNVCSKGREYNELLRCSQRASRRSCHLVRDLWLSFPFQT
jgi:hypothetical protein